MNCWNIIHGIWLLDRMVKIDNSTDADVIEDNIDNNGNNYTWSSLKIMLTFFIFQNKHNLGILSGKIKFIFTLFDTCQKMLVFLKFVEINYIYITFDHNYFSVKRGGRCAWKWTKTINNNKNPQRIVCDIEIEISGRPSENLIR